MEKPGQFPFTRGIYPDMYAKRGWTMRQYAGFSTAEETNQRYRYLLGQGQTGLSVAFDLPTQMGYDPTDGMARGEVGKSGVSIATLSDMETLFDGISQDKVTVSMTINATAMILLSLHIAAAEKKGISPNLLGGTVQNDVLKEFVARGCYIYPPRPSLKIAIDVIEYCTQHLPRWNSISISGYHIREAGATAAQELGFTLANGIAYVQGAIERNLDINAVGKRISFFFNAHSDFLEEISKFRAARRLWAKIMKDRFGATDPKAQMCRFHTQTAGSTLTAQQPENNVVRVTLQAMSAVLGGTQSLHTNAMDEALSLPTESAAKLALRTQQILADESGVRDVADPFGGATHIEQETDRLEAEALEYIQKIDEQGGAVESIAYETGEIEKSALEAQRKIEEKEQVIVGVNQYEETEEDSSRTLLRVDSTLHESRTATLEKIRKERSLSQWQNSVDQLRRAAENGENLVPPVLDCVRSSVTLGEICSVLREQYGTQDPTS